MPKTKLSELGTTNKIEEGRSNKTPTDTSISKFTLPNKKVTLRPIVRKKSFMGRNDHDGLFMYTGAFQVWSIFRDQFGNYIDPLTTTERLYLEKALNEDLNVNHKGNYWESFEVKIQKDTYEINELKREFDLSNPKDYLAYKLLLTAPDVANNIAEKDNTPEYRWVLVEKDEPIQGKLNKAKKKAFCYKWLSENENKPSMLKDVLYVLGVSISRDASKDNLISNIVDLIEGNKLDNLYETLNDDNFHTEVLFNKALKLRLIIFKNGKFYNKTGDVIAVTRSQCMEWLANPENDTYVKLIESEIKKANL